MEVIAIIAFICIIQGTIDIMKDAEQYKNEQRLAMYCEEIIKECND